MHAVGQYLIVIHLAAGLLANIRTKPNRSKAFNIHDNNVGENGLGRSYYSVTPTISEHFNMKNFYCLSSSACLLCWCE